MFRLYKIKEGKEKQWRSWADFLNSHWEEVAKTMKEEGLTNEKCLIVNDLIIYITTGKNLPSTNREINKKHIQQIKECLEPIKGDILFDFST